MTHIVSRSMQVGRRGARIGLVVALGVVGIVVPATARAATPIAPVTDRGLTPPVGAHISIDDASATPPALPQPRLDSVMTARARASVTTVTVEIEGTDAAIAAAVAAAGGTLGRGGGGLFLATVRSDRLPALAGTDGITQVRQPVEVASAHVDVPSVERGPIVSRNWQASRPWHDAGYTGAGSKVGVVGLFDLTVLANQIATGEIPDVPSGNRICVSSGATCPFGTPGATFGNSLAEIISDGAPDASLYLAELGSRGDYYSVIDWMASNGVTILLNPIIWTYDGPGNGTGPSAAIINYAVSKGIAWFNTGGEMARAVNPDFTTYAGTYYRSYWNDTDNDRWMNFNGADESMGVYCGMLLGLRWSDWGATRTDYDLYISDYNPSNGVNATKVLLSGADQSLPGAQPLEGTSGTRLCNTNPANGPVYDTNKDGFVSLWVKYEPTRSTGNPPAYDIIEIGTYYGWLEYQTDPGSVGIAFADSANPGMLTVSGLRGQVLMDFPNGSYGPTNDGRTKPDMVSWPCTDTSVDGSSSSSCSTSGYFGSDAAAAAVAGWAALTKPVIGLDTPAVMARYLRDQGTNLYGVPIAPTQMVGYGMATLPAVPPTYQATNFTAISPTRVIESRGAPYATIGMPAHRLIGGETVHYNVGSQFGSATSLLLNVTMVNVSKPGFISVYPAGWAAPGQVATLNADMVGQTRSNTVIVPIGDQGYIDIFANVPTDVVIDVLGVFAADPETGYGSLVNVSPTRLVDTRTCVGVQNCTGQPVQAGTWTDIDVRGFSDPGWPAVVIPDNASAVALSVTADTPSGRGFMAVVPGNSAATTSSNLNFESGQSGTALTFVKIDGGANGVVRVLMNRTAHLQVDILGWFTGPLGYTEPAGQFVPVRPFRLLDSREPTASAPPPPAAGQVVPVNAVAAGVPTSAGSVFVNNVAVQAAAAGEVQVADTAQPQPPGFRNLTVGAANQTRATSTITRLADGTFTMTGTMTAHYVSDIAGYFVGATLSPLPPGQTHPATGAALSRDPVSLVSWSHDYNSMSDDGRFVLGTGDASPSGMRLYDATTDSTTTILPLTTNGVLSGNGSTVAYDGYSQAVGASPQVWAYDVATAISQKVSIDDSTGDFVDGTYATLGGVSSSGTLIAFMSTAVLAPGGTAGLPNIYVRNLTTQTNKLVGIAGQYLAVLKISSDGSTVAWTEVPPGMPPQLMVYKVASATGVSWPLPSAMVTNLDLDGSGSVALVSSFTNGSPCLSQPVTLTRVNTATGTATTIPVPSAATTCSTRSIQLSDDGATIMIQRMAPYLSVANGGGAIFLLGMDGSVIERVDRTWNGYAPRYPSIAAVMSPNGEFVAYTNGSDNILVTPNPDATVYIFARHPT